MAASHMNWRYNDLIRRNVVHQKAGCRDIRNGIHGSHLMEMNLRNRNAMGMALCLGNQAVNSHHILPDLVRKIQVIADDVLNVVKTAVMMVGVTVMGMFVTVMGVIGTGSNRMVMVLVNMLMVMSLAAVFMVMMMIVLLMAVIVVMVIIMFLMMVEHLLGLFFSMYLHGHVGSANAAFAHGFLAKFHPWNPQTVQFCHSRIRIRHQFQ